MGLPQTIKGLSGGVNPAALGHCTRRTGLVGDLAGTVTFYVDLFEVLYGPILVTSFYGKVTTVIAGATTVIQLHHTPTGLAREALCLVIGATINADPADTMYIIPGAPGAAMTVSDQVGVCDASMGTSLLILVPGITEMSVQTEEATGVIDWTLHWVPLDTDSRVAVL